MDITCKVMFNEHGFFRLHVQVTHARTQEVVFQITKSIITVVSAPQAIQTLIARQVSKTAHHSILV